jgi:sulfur carrier protein
MQLIINGEQRDYAVATVQELLLQLEIDPARVAVELNQNILPKAEYGSRSLKDGDTLEIVQFVGGG